MRNSRVQIYVSSDVTDEIQDEVKTNKQISKQTINQKQTKRIILEKDILSHCLIPTHGSPISANRARIC